MALATYFLIFSIIFQTTNVALCADVGFDNVQQSGFGNETSRVTNPNYPNNVNSLFSIFVSESSRGFFNTSTGQGSDRAYGTYLCRGDLSAEECHTCLERVRDFAVNPLRSYYPDSVIFQGQLQCVAHYANSSTLFDYRENSTFSGVGSGDDLAQHPQYNTTLLSALQEIATEAGYGNWSRTNFATKVVDVAGTQDKIHILAQCTPYISAMNCSNCLRDLYTTFTPYRVGGDALGFNCLLMYNNEPLSASAAYRNLMPSYFHAILVLLWATYVTFM